MGIINNDPFETPYGTTVTGVYMAIGENSIDIQRQMDIDGQGTAFQMYSSAGVWIDKAARDAGKSQLSVISISCNNMTDAQLAEAPYTCAYNILKTMYPNNTDA